ncbi:MAG: hypothetical protein PHH70_04390 [Candidatus Gracilibacteria bacterium]|nr:hypothetical protein [Candidatus Gracilibacteria bacterium]
MANSHGLSARLVKKQAAARKLSKGKKKSFLVYTGNESKESRYNLSYKKRTRYFQNKQAFPSKKLPTKNIDSLVELGILDERGFFRKGKKKNYITKRMTDAKGLDFYGLPR